MIRQALDGLFTKDYFSICTLDSILDVLGQTRHTEAYRLLHTLHCVHYRDMSPDMRECLPRLVNEALRPPLVHCAATDIAMEGIAA